MLITLVFYFETIDIIDLIDETLTDFILAQTPQA